MQVSRIKGQRKRWRKERGSTSRVADRKKGEKNQESIGEPQY
jgi:ribosomal protein L32E